MIAMRMIVVSDGDGHVRRPVLRARAVTSSSVELWWADDPAATGWWVRCSPGHGRYQATGQPYWFAANLNPGTTYEFRVFAVDEDHREASEKAVLRVSTAKAGPTAPCPLPAGPARSGGRIRTTDLQVMSLPSYQAALPRCLVIVSRAVVVNAARRTSTKARSGTVSSRRHFE